MDGTQTIFHYQLIPMVEDALLQLTSPLIPSHLRVCAAHARDAHMAYYYFYIDLEIDSSNRCHFV